MSKSGNYYMSELEKRDAIIQAMLEALKRVTYNLNLCRQEFVRMLHGSFLRQHEDKFKSSIEMARAAIALASSDERYCTDCGIEIGKTTHPDIVYCSECDTFSARGIR